MAGRLMRKHGPAIRGGFTLAEVLASIAVTTILVGGMAAFTVRIWNEMAAARVREGVAQWAAGTLEQARTPQVAKDLQAFASKVALPEHLTRQMSDPKVQAKVTPVTDAPILRRIDLEIAWTNRNGSPARPLVLSTLIPLPGDKP
jgi:Tfp pilus assembly protein PilV